MRLFSGTAFRALRGSKYWNPSLLVQSQTNIATFWRRNAHASPQPDAFTAVFVDHLGCSEDVADRAVSKVLNGGKYLKVEKSLAMCDALQSRLPLDEVQLKNIVTWLPSVPGCSFESNIVPSLAALQERLSLKRQQYHQTKKSLQRPLRYRRRSLQIPRS